MKCCHPEARTSKPTLLLSRAAETARDLATAGVRSGSEDQSIAVARSLGALRQPQDDTKGEAPSLYQERCGTELFDELLRSCRRQKPISFRFILHHASHRADADKISGHHLFWHPEKEDQMDKLFRWSESNASRTPPNPQDDTLDEIGPRMRKSNSLACIRRTSSLSFHDGIGEFVVVLDVSVVTKPFRYFQNCFRRRALAQFEYDQFGI